MTARTGRAQCGTGNGGRLGFTLIGTIAALVLVGLLAVVVVARLPQFKTEATADADALKGYIRYTQTRAMADTLASTALTVSTTWSFTVSGKTGTFSRNDGTSWTPQSTVSFATTGVGAGSIYFDNRGRPSGQLTFPVAGYAGGSVTVNSATGFVQ